ncbi:MAG: DNA sulfur modification protein DndD [Chitinophagales bacterium]|jgi:DNA sulfur modification protein DndD|nr:DNA sulfur modification protein DndD [Chitinophagales bacterium]
MKLSAIYLKNFKGFKGTQKVENLENSLDDNENIILIGGLNGAGKTSFLEALFLCFYGEGAKKLYPTRGAKRENYTSYLISLLNNDIKTSGQIKLDMSVEILIKELPITSEVPRDVSFRRRWDFISDRGNLILENETFTILENGDLIEDLPSSEYQERINAILPYEVSQFFFFDGEKIQDFASDSDEEFANSLKDVLGINLYAKLSGDIGSVRMKILAEYNKNKDSNAKILEREREKMDLETKIDDFKSQIITLNDEIDNLDIDLEKINNETKRIMRLSNDNRDSISSRKEQLEENRESLEKDYLDISKDYLPFILTKGIFEELDNQLDKEDEYLRQLATQEAVEPKIDGIISEIFREEPEDIKLKPNQKRYFESKIDRVIRKFLLNGESIDLSEDIKIIHNLPPPDKIKIKQFFNTLNNSIIKSLNNKASQLKDIEITLDKIRQVNIRSGESSDETQKLDDTRRKIIEEIGRKKQQIEDFKFDIQESKNKLEIVNREITNWQNKAELNNKQKKEIEYCEKLQATIKDFQKKYQAKRTYELEEAIFEMWQNLTHKPDYIKAVKINPDANFEVKLFDYNNIEIDKTKLSAGEKEIYAISLLWALVKVSGKSLPIVIDTPFGRLDSSHRENLVTKYFPKASHQVILLSQDEEIVGRYYDLIKPCVAKSFTIYSINGESSITRGYPFAN